MMSTKFDPSSFFQQTEHVALNVAGEEIFGLLKRSLDLPAAWAAMVTRNTGDQLVTAPGATVDGHDADAVLFVRTTPIEIDVVEEGLTSRDRFRVQAQTSIGVRIIPERGELDSFQRAVLGSHRVVMTARVAQFLQPAVRAAFSRFVAERNVDELIKASSAEGAAQAMVDALKEPCFQAGLTLEGRPVVTFDSASHRTVQAAQERAALRAAEYEAGKELTDVRRHAQRTHLDHVATMLERLEGMASDSPDATLPELIRTFSESERGEIYGALFASRPASSTTRWIVVAAGDELLFFDPADLASPSRRLTLTGAAGAVRSVQAVKQSNGEPALLIGGASGIYHLPLDGAEPDLTYVVPGSPTVRGGFNAACQAGDRVLASHSELGLWEWPCEDASSGQPCFASLTNHAKTVRGVTILEDRAYASIDDRVIAWRAGQRKEQPDKVCTGSDATITAICPTAEGLYAGNSDGDILFWRSDSTTNPEQLHRGMDRAAESVWPMSDRGVRRIIYTDTSLAVFSRVVGDSYVCRYEAGGQTLRRVEVAPDLIVATSDLRDRLVCWRPDEPGRPMATINVASLCQRSVQDVCLV